ncbi:MAG: hypothetical protein PHP59_10190 [Methanofollis sp.]|uniref:hypothetical protein n=1 Tax=Methanofollis sp. TaxID=2052835 RepID=UPI00261B6B07|nr:hypothetical protein [Methanofollis sp.]MDD4255726.1 hypothetical protein [Methanofollis sp.]
MSNLAVAGDTIVEYDISSDDKGAGLLTIEGTAQTLVDVEGALLLVQGQTVQGTHTIALGATHSTLVDIDGVPVLRIGDTGDDAGGHPLSLIQGPTQTLVSEDP